MQIRYNQEMNERAAVFIKKTLLDEIETGLGDLLDFDVDMECDKNEENLIVFKYPKLYRNDVILNTIRLEFGSPAAWTPSEVIKVSPYINDYYPNIMNQPYTEVLTVKPIRTFWEKATILHHEANRPNTSSIPDRYSRHYYDLHMMLRDMPMENLSEDIDLLDSVVGFKKKFYPRGWAQYDLAKKGTLRLVPDQYRFEELEKDYKEMQDMLFGEKPSFGEILSSIGEFEKTFNG